jgi:hypothetical protein
MKQEFTLSPYDIKLIDEMLSTTPSRFMYPVEHISDIMKTRMLAVWNVLGEKHGFVGETVEQSPKGEPTILANPITYTQIADNG